MQLVCPQCQATFELDPPAAPFARDQNLVFRCTACGHSIPIRRGESEPTASVVDVPERPEPEQQGFLLRQEGKLYQVKDVAMLQRWIAERRIWRTDEISRDGNTWQTADELEGVSIFFELVDQAEKSSGTGSPSGKGLFAKPKSTGDALASIQMPGPSEAVEQTSVDSTAVVEAVVAEEFDVPDPDEDTSIVEVEEATPLRLAVEAIPEEVPAALPSIDEPTMDLGEDDFFSEEQSMDFGGSLMDSGGDYDDELEWMQAKRKSMVTWWLLFFGALGGAGYFALDFLNQQDTKEQKEAVATTEGPEQPTGTLEPENVVAQQADIQNEEQTADKTAASAGTEEQEEPEPVLEVVENAAEEPPAPAVETPAPSVQPVAAPPPTAPPAPAAPVRINPDREIDRGWIKIDREAWDSARTHFNNALRVDPGNGDAKFGLAYVNENQGRVDEAVRQYCRLQATGSGEAKAEAAGRLRALGRDCP